MSSAIFSFYLCLLFHFGLQNCPEEITNAGIRVKWQQTAPANNVISNPVCYANDRLITRDCIDSVWKPPADELNPCSQVIKYYNLSTCPPGFEKISKNNNEYCYQIQNSSSWNYPCLRSGGASAITDLNNEDLTSLLASLVSKNISRYFWLPAKREKFFSPVQWYIPGPKWKHPVESYNKLKIQTSIFKNCLLLDAEQEVLITESCTENHYNLCFYINDIQYPAKCPENYHSVRYMPDEGMCLGIEYSPRNLTFDEFIQNKICKSPMGGRDIDDLTRYIFKKIAEINNLPSDVWCWFAATNWNSEDNSDTSILSLLFPNIYVSINNIGSLSLINPTPPTYLPCMACQTEVIYEQTELIIEYDDIKKIMYLTIYFPSGLWKYDQNDRGIQCFSDAKGFVKVIDIDDIPFIEIDSYSQMFNDTLDIDKIVYAINLITDRAAQYWCEGHTKDFALIETDKIVVNPQGDEVHVFSLVITVFVPNVDILGDLETVRDNLCTNITNIFGANKVLVMDYLEYERNYLMVLMHMDITINNIYNDKSRNIENTFSTINEIADTELLKYNYNLVNISSSMYCLPAISEDNSFTLNWELTPIGRITAPKQFCLQENGLPVRRRCAGSYVLGSFWDEVVGTCNKNYQPSDTTTFLYNFVNGQVPANDTSHFLTDGLGFVLSDVNIIIPADIYYLSMSLQHILHIAQENESLVDMGNFQNIAWVMDRLMVLNSNYLRLAQTLNSTNVILDSVNNIIEMLTHKSAYMAERLTRSRKIEDRFESFTNFKGNRNNISSDYQLAVEPQFILQISFPWLNNISGVAVINNAKVNKFTEMKIKPLFKNTTLKEILAFENLEIATWLPDYLLSTLKISNNETEINYESVHVIISVFHNDAIFQEIDNHSYKVNSRIIGVSIPGFVSNLEKPIPLVYKDLFPAVEGRVCGYWDFQSNSADKAPGYWSNSGCYLRKTVHYLNYCECYHLTNFGQLLDIRRGKNDSDTLDMQKHDKPLNIISLVGSFLSLLGIMGIWVTASVFHAWRKKAGTKVLLHLSASIALPLLFMIVFNLDGTIFEEKEGITIIFDQSKAVCISLGALLHYSVLASFMWMLITAVLQFIRYVRVLGVYRPSRFMIKFTLIGWGIPLIPVIVVLALDMENYIPVLVSSREYKFSICYPSGFYLIVTVIVPICIILFINVTLFILVIYAISKGPDGKMRRPDMDLIRAQLRLSIFLFFLLGLTWIFGIVSFSKNIIWSYLFCLTSTMQGFILFIYFVICDTQTRNLWVTLMKPQFRPSSSRESITSISSS
ncbi:unnamed protein product [Euphydryas editha]|uniref:G-protein coupled receptor n=1 Tax=Euphydryas editha TaxID=104508 RepID=A0AAU9URP5_EUPED|nr:unnamed protein product [Euphydryas editha]